MKICLIALMSFLVAAVAAADSPSESDSKWKTAGLRQANSMGGGEASIPKSGKLRVFVLMGQSNMSGAARAKNLEPPYTEKHERIRIWANGRWEYFVPTNRFGPGVSLARQLAEFWPEDTIGIIKVASGGTGIRGFEKEWSFERANRTFDGKKGPLYQDLMNAVAEARRVSETEFSGFVWKQGGADGTKKDLAHEYFDTFKQLVTDLRADLGVPDLPVVVPVNMSEEALLEVILSNISDKDLAEAKESANTPPDNDIELLKVLVPYLEENPPPDLKKLLGKRSHILSVFLAQTRAGREIPNTTTISHERLPVLDDGIHFNAEGQIQLGKVAASAIEAFYQTKAPHSAMAEGNSLEQQILKLAPQADTNGDGQLSKEEDAALTQRILKRFPQADADGDGVLSDPEKQAMIRRAAARAGQAMEKKTKPGTKQAEGNRAPTHTGVKYGDHERQIFDIWLAESDTPTPLAIYIHGGGFRAGSKENLNPNERDQLLEAGISVAAINYRFMSVDTPLPTPHHDARRALQTTRSKAEEWNIDKERIAAFGGSAGAQICMWLAYSDEMANPDSEDPIERESTRLTCVATRGGQTTNSAEYWKNLFTSLLGPNIDTNGFSRPLGDITDPEQARIAMWGAKTLEEAEGIASRHSALSLISADDPPIFMSYFMSPTAKPPTETERIRGWVIHHVNFGLTLKEKTDALEVEAHLKYPGTETPYSSQIEFFVDKLLQK